MQFLKLNQKERTMMKITKWMKAAVFTTAIATASGCVSRPVTFVEASKPIEHGKYSGLSSEVTGTYNQMSFLFLSFGLPGSSQRRAMQDAIDKVPGADALVSMAVDTEVFEIMPFLCPVIGFYTTRVTGTPVQTFTK